jgi:hypothetical protein
LFVGGQDGETNLNPKKREGERHKGSRKEREEKIERKEPI